MCDEVSDAGKDVTETLREAREKGWVPTVVILAKLDGEGIATAHLHYLWMVEDETALDMALSLIYKMHLELRERDMRRAREN